MPSWVGDRRAALRSGLEAPDRPGAVVAEEVAAAQRGNARAAVDIAADDGADRAAVRVRPDRIDQRPLLRQLDLRVVDHRAFETAPAVVREHADLRQRAEVDLLVLGRADVADPEVARLPVEREPPRVAESHPDRLPPRARAVRRDPQQLAQRAAEVLRVVLRIAGGDVAGGWVGAAVAEADVEPALLVELELAALVIRIRLLHHEQVVRARRHADTVRRGQLGDVAVAVQVAVVDVELVVLRVARVEREREETALAVVEHPAAQVEKRARRSSRRAPSRSSRAARRRTTSTDRRAPR